MNRNSVAVCVILVNSSITISVNHSRKPVKQVILVRGRAERRCYGSQTASVIIAVLYIISVGIINSRQTVHKVICEHSCACAVGYTADFPVSRIGIVHRAVIVGFA